MALEQRPFGQCKRKNVRKNPARVFLAFSVCGDIFPPLASTDDVAPGFVDRKFKECCKPRSGQSRLYSYQEALTYLRGNPFITHGYRQNYSVRETLRSLFTIHNESANIWSHLIGWLLFFYFTLLSVWSLLVSEADADLVHQTTVVIYCTGAMTLLACSTSFHWLGCVSDEVYALTAKLDYTGIAVLILVSFFPFIYSFYYSSPKWGLFWCLNISILTVAAIFVSWSETFSRPGYQKLRAGLFVGVGLVGGFVLPHACYSLGVDQSWDVLWPLLLMGGLYIGGAALYAMHIPERFFPGKLNVIGHSHFLFHCCVVAAALVHYWNIHRLVEFRKDVFGAIA